ncbi:hypothetical protein OEA41_007892 [Lepraria neglecta]|uniref:NAD(P)-binding protein n=1 Tax=Lepraria neglecta TaxID=209136 RepID=A0AAD9ZGD5_9LECA|nr:hypothetical protein OEA41_007892 [Lepraria neglecta]
MFGAKAFSGDDIPDQTGKVFLVTGGTSGLGLETCRQLLKHNATVYFTARNLDKAEATRKEIIGNGHSGEGNANLHVVHMDLSDLESIKKGADSFKAGLNRLDVLINNGMSFAVLPNVK